MVAPTKINFKVYQGSTFKETIRWEDSVKKYATITGITKAAPMVVTAPAHGMPTGWRGKISNVVGMKEINSDDYLQNYATTTDTITFNTVNSIGYTAYVSGGVIEYNAPMSLVGLTARMQIRPKLSSEEIIDSLTTENGGINLDATNNVITLNITATQTAAYTFKSAVYSIEILNGATVIPLAFGTMTLEAEITR